MDLIQHPHWLGDKKADFDYLYLPLALKAAVTTNPDLNVIYINANDTKLGVAGVTEIPLVSIDEDISRLADSYLHLSTNPFLFELRSIQRHFALRNLMRSHSLQSAFVSEGDVLLLKPFKILYGESCEISASALLTDKVCVSTGWVTLEYVEFLCDLVLTIYSSESLRKGIQQIFDDMQRQGSVGGICDMTFCHFVNIGAYGFNNQLIVKDICTPQEVSGITYMFDNFLPKLNAGGTSFKSSRCSYDKQVIKKLSQNGSELHSETTEGEQIVMSSLHFQGESKRLMGLYFANLLS
jgi:hypothetical protein